MPKQRLRSSVRVGYTRQGQALENHTSPFLSNRELNGKRLLLGILESMSPANDCSNLQLRWFRQWRRLVCGVVMAWDQFRQLNRRRCGNRVLQVAIRNYSAQKMNLSKQVDMPVCCEYPDRHKVTASSVTSVIATIVHQFAGPTQPMISQRCQFGRWLDLLAGNADDSICRGVTRNLPSLARKHNAMVSYPYLI